MFSYIKRHWPVYLILALIAIALGFGAAYIVGVKGSTPESTINEEVEHEQSLGADGISESDQALIDGGSASGEYPLRYTRKKRRAGRRARLFFIALVTLRRQL